jgi:hypothetical protein
MQSIDEISKQRAKELFGSTDLSSFEVGIDSLSPAVFLTHVWALIELKPLSS